MHCESSGNVRLLVKTIILLAVFANFFGFYIVQSVSTALGVPRGTPFLWNSRSAESILELSIVFACSLVVILLIPYRKAPKINASGERTCRRYAYWAITFFLIFICLTQLSSVNLSLNITGRGIGQFDRDLGSALSRISLLVLPLMLTYRVTYSQIPLARFVAGFTVLSYSVVSISNGDRRILMYYLIAFALIKFRETFITNSAPGKIRGRKRPKKWSFIVLAIFAITLPIASYYIRAMNDPGWSAMVLAVLVLHSTLGALGIGAILSEVKLLIAAQTGFLYGSTFINYVLSLAAPSALLVALGGSEFFLRSSFLFNDAFNDNPNQGYDFMMVADFFWNFGYLGYVLYIILVFFVARFSIRSIYSGRDSSFIYGALIIIFFIAGQRSDFGLFLKSSLYTIAFAKIVLVALAAQGKTHSTPARKAAQ